MFVLETPVSQQEIAGLIGSTVRDVMTKNHGSPRAKVEVSQRLLRIAEGFDSDSAHKQEREREHMRVFNRALRTGLKFMQGRDREAFEAFQQERRDMSDSLGGAYPGSPASFFVPVAFEQHVWQMMKQVDRLFDPEIVTFLRTDKGGPMSVPMLDDTESAASVIQQGQSTVQQEPATLGQLSFGICPTWQSGMWKVSRSLMEDNAVNIPDLFASTSAKRFRRGIGKSLVTTLINAATLGRVAQGSASTDGQGSINTVGIDDLHALLSSLDPEYLASPKCRWVMNWSTYQALLQVKDLQKRPVLVEQYNADGEPVLLGRPVAICPSMASMSPTISSPQESVIPIALGDLSRFVVRVVSGSMRIIRLEERWAESFQLGFESYARVDSGVMVTGNASSPVQYLQTAA
jgi:HK97 family phage major capsid protein